MTTCAVDGCAKPATAGRGWCSLHYGRWRRHGDPLKVHVPPAECAVAACERPPRCRGMCDLHYQRWSRTGSTRPPKRGCRKTTPKGYVVIQHGDVRRYEHRLVMVKLIGRELFPGEVVHHVKTRSDNRPENLWIWPSAASHREWHLMLEERRELRIEMPAVPLANTLGGKTLDVSVEEDHAATGKTVANKDAGARAGTRPQPTTEVTCDS